jgi:ubiquinone/menaquinone biosynthesis C-methylase UbiE
VIGKHSRLLPEAKQEGQMGNWAPYYDLLMFFMTFGREGTLRRVTLDLAGVQPGDRVLEIGSGTGTLTLASARRVGASGKAFGIDVAPEMVAAASRKATRKHVAASFQIGSMEKIPSTNRCFDVVMCSFMIFHMPDDVRRRGLAEVQRVLKDGGRLLILDFALPDRMGYGRYHIRTLVPALTELSFSQVELGRARFLTWLGRGGIGLWYLRGTCTKP